MNWADRADGPAEFDAYADGYGAGMESPVKALVGESSEDFIAVKVDFLERFLGRAVHDPTGRLLDFGCGTASLLKQAAGRGWPLELLGADTSSAMLEEARKDLSDTDPSGRISLHHLTGPEIPVPDGHCSIVVASSVLHHMESADHVGFAREVHRVLRPGGLLVILEHNPWNPVTRFVVSRTPIDRNAVLLSHRRSVELLARAGFATTEVHHLMFLPPRWAGLRPLEHRLHRLPIGGQYAAIGRRGI